MVFVLLSILCVLTGCTSKKKFSGAILNEEDFKKISVQSSSISQVRSVLGSPSFTSANPQNKILYYVLGEVSIKPTRLVKLNQFTTYKLQFDKKGTLQSIDEVISKRVIRPNKIYTPPVYKRPPILEEVLSSSATRFQ